jgi:predicted nucleic-acid-binding protein
MVILAIIVVVKVYSGSKSTFAFVLISLTALLGTCYVVYAFDDAFVK